ncbi:ABC transporter ATP-binding protein [Desulfomonile tiedjei]|uniref:ABC-type antimicrobial peptide transport system, ATPase component n=1 Tax=Desulfomonile tiedjei (strain ATCC 49306 / DSM 6799 / DCB-1) TaxID=706587 RepID=I4CEU6_DESTA|nr:ABC transporter ATP-binding protein [Desulfomonile tiedjei]AFM28087.1 ABC-type antimicrobial peptide transport system, ATPase component [Desulfomonile tiedjei DSM 6799]
MIRVENLSKVFQKDRLEVRVLQDISLSISEGEFVSIMAPSGMGKSTLLNILGCLDKPTGGVYILDGVPVQDMDDDQLSNIRNQKIGFVFQSFHLLPRMTAWENVILPLIYSDIETDMKERAVQVLSSVGLADRVDHLPRELSGGQQQRVAIARALINSPRIILADEPTGNLDSASGQEVMRIFRDLHAAGTTLIIVTHDVEVANQADRIISMKDGSISSDRLTESKTAEVPR